MLLLLLFEELAENYTTFTKTSEENKGKVKFITIVDSLKKDEDTTIAAV